MRKKVLKIFICLAFILMFSFGIAGCGPSEQEKIEELCGDSVGTYFITGESYEVYVRDCAKQIGADEQWISDVLNGGDGGEWHYMIRPQSWFWCVIADNQMTVSKIDYTVYDISKDGDGYQGKSIAGTVSFGFNGDILYVTDNEETLEFKKDNSYQRTETKATSLASPKKITVNSGGEELNFVTFQWDYQADYGNVGAAIEIKKAGASEYKTVDKIQRAYMNTFVVQLDKAEFEVGENLVRIYHIGGPSITNDHSIIVKKNSDYVTYRVTVKADGSVTVK